MAAEWKSMGNVANTLPAGRVVAMPAPAPGAGKP